VENQTGDAKKKTGIDPNVMAKSSSNIQKYMNQIADILPGMCYGMNGDVL